MAWTDAVQLHPKKEEPEVDIYVRIVTAGRLRSGMAEVRAEIFASAALSA